MIAFRGQKRVGPRPDWSLLGVNSKIPTSIPAPFIWEFPPDCVALAAKNNEAVEVEGFRLFA